MPLIELPNKKYFRVPEGLTDEEALARARDRFPFLYEDQNIVGRGARALGRGISELGESASGIALGARSAFGDKEGAQRAIDEQRKSAEKEAKEPRALSFEQLQDIYKTQGLGSAISNVPSYITEQVLQSAPSMAAPLAAGAYGTALGGPLAGAAAGIGTYGLQQFGQFMNRQAATPGRTAETLEPGTAAVTAAATAPLGFLVDRFTLGLGKIPEKTALNLITKEIAARGVGKTLAVGAAKGLLEVPTEVLEQAAERYQAGLSLTDKEAVAEYKEAAAGALAVGTVAGAGSAYYGKGKAEEAVAKQNQFETARRNAETAAIEERQKGFEALPGAALARPATKKMEALPAYGGTQTDIFGEVGGAYTPLQGQALPEGLETQQPEMALQDEYRKVKAEADRLNGVVEKALEEKNIPAYNEALLQLKQLDAAQSELVKKAKATGIVLDVDAELKAAQTSAQRYMTKRQPIPQALVQSVQQLQAQKAQQMQQQAGAAPGPQADLFNLPKQAEARNTMAAQMQDEYVAPVPPVALTPDAISAQQQEMFEQDTAQKQAENFAQNAEEPSYLQPKPPSAEELEGAFLPQPKQPDLTTGLLTGMEDIQQQKEEYPQKRAAAEKEFEYQKVMQRAEGQLKNPVLALAISKAKGKDSEMLRKRVEVISAAVNQGGLTSDAVSLLGLRIPEGTPTQKLPALETETGLRLQYDLRDPQQAEMLLPVIKEVLDATNAAKIKLASDLKVGQLYKDGQLTESGKKVVALEAKSRTLQQLVDAAKAPPKELKATQPLQARDEAEAAVKEREQHLFDLGNAIDSLRKGTLEDPDVEGLQDKARNLKDLMIGAVIKEAKAQRTALGAPALSEAEIDATVDKLDKQFSKLIDAAPLSAAVRLPEKNKPAKKEQLPVIRDANGRSRVQLAAEITRLTARVSVLTDYVARNAAIPAKLQQSLQESSGFKNLRAALAQNKTSPTKLLQNFRAKLSILNADLVALDKRIAQQQLEVSRKAAIPEKQQQRKPGISPSQSLLEEKGIPIRRGMKMGASGRSELTKLRRDVGRAAYELSFPQKESGTQYVKASQFKGRIPKKVVVETKKTEPAKSKAKIVSLEAVSDAVGVFKTEARLSLEQTKLTKQRVAKAISEGLTAEKSVTAILRDAQTATNTGISPEGLKRLKTLIDAARNAPRIAKTEKITSRKEKPVTATAIGTRTVGEAERLQKAVDRLAERVEANPQSKKLAKQLKNAESILRTAERAKNPEIVPFEEAVKAQQLDLLVRKRLEKTAQLAQARAALAAVAGSSGSSDKALTKVNERVKEIKNKVIKLEEQLDTPKETPLEDQRGIELRKRVAQEKDPNVRKLMLQQGAKMIQEVSVPRLVKDEIAALKLERLQLEKQKRAVRRAGKDLSTLPEQIDRIENLLKEGGYDISLYASPVETLQAQAASNREAGIATRYEGRKSDRDNKLSQQTIKKRAVENAPSNIKTRTQGGKYGPTVVAAKKKPPPAFKRRLKDPIDWADAHDLQGEERNAFLGYAENANASAKFDKTDNREATPQDNGVDLKAAADVVARVKKALPKGIKFIYAPTLKDAPPEFLASLYFKDMDTAKGAVLPDGTVVVIGEAHKSTADLEETIAHELIGHYGVDTVLGPERMQALVDRLFKQGDKHVADVATALNVFPDVETALAARDLLKNPDIRMMIVREMIAHAAEGRRVAPTFTEQVKGLIRDMIAAVRGLFRNMGLSDMAKRDAKEIQALIRESSRSLAAGRLGIYRTPDGEIAFRKGNVKMAPGFEDIQDFSDSAITQQKSILDRLKADSKGLAFKVAYVDQLAAVQQVADQMTDSNAAMQMMYNLDQSLNLMQMASASARDGALDIIKVENGVFRIAPKKGASLRTTDAALAPLLDMGFNAEGANQLFTSYIGALRGEQVGYDKLNFSDEIQAKARRVLPTVNANKEVKAVLDAARKEYNAFNKNNVTFLEKTGAISKEEADRLRSKEDYIPYYRDDNGILNLYVGGETPIRIGNLKDQPYLQRLVGGDQQIMDYFTSSMQNTMLLTDMGLRNIAVKNASYTMLKLGIAKIGNGNGPTNANVVRFKDAGKPKYAIYNTENTPFANIPTELIAKGMEGMAVIVPDWLKMMALPAQVLRKGITLNPLYSYYQLFKDSMIMGATRGVGFSNSANVIRGVNQYINGGKLIEEMQSRGIASGQGYTGTMDDVAQIRRHIMQGGTNPHRLLASLEARSLKADGAVRAMLYQSYIKQGLNERDAEYMSRTAMPYHRRGISPGLRFISHMLPFFNAQIVGLHSLYQSFTGKMPYAEKLKIRKKLWGAGMMMAMSTLAYAASVGEEDWYKNMPLETRLRNWLVKLPFFDEPIAIPIPFEYGILFKGFAEATYLGMFKDSPEGAKVRDAYRKMLLGIIPGGTIPVEMVPGLKAVPMPIPTAAAPVLEIASNKSFFDGRDIESQSELALQPAERYRDSTSELAKSLGKSMNVSPLQIDHLIRGYTGTVGPAMVALVDALTGPANTAIAPKADVPMSKLPIMSQMFKPADGNALIDLAFETLKEAESIKKTYERIVQQPGREREAETYLEKNMPMIERGKMASQFQKNLADIKRAMQSIQLDTVMTSFEKRQALKEMQQIRIDAAKQYQEAFKQAA